MKLLRIILVISAITLILSKSENAKVVLSANVNNENKSVQDKAVLDHFTEMPIAGVAVPNDSYLLQQSAVNKNKNS